METLRRSRTPSGVVTANGEVQTNEEAQVYVHDLGLFVTVQLLEDTLEVLSLGKLYEEHRYSYEWVSGQQPRLTKTERSDGHAPGNWGPENQKQNEKKNDSRDADGPFCEIFLIVG